MHSHVDARYRNFALYQDGVCTVNFLAQRGGRVSWLDSCITSRSFRSRVPSIVVLNIGGNDLDSWNARPQVIGMEMFVRAKRLVDMGAKQVVISEIVPRLAWRDLPIHVGNEKVATINEFLAAVCDGHPHILFWRHVRLPKVNQKSIMRDDGVHFDDAGNKMLFRSIRGAILSAAKRI